MHTFKLAALLVLLLATTSILADDNCDNCAQQNLQCCDNKCFNTSTASCETNTNGVSVLCGFQHLPAQTPDALCGAGTACYDTITYGCCNATSTIYGLGSAAAKNCPTVGPSAGTECSDATICATGLECCNGKCYNPSTAGCETSSTGGKLLCGFQHLPDQLHDGACGDICYDLIGYGCCNATSTLYDLSMGRPAGCDGITTDSPTTAPTTGPTNSPTAVPTGSPSSCGSITCGSGLSCCAGQCYNPGEASCETSNTGAVVLCGFQHLPDTTPDAACGTTCYDTLDYGCCNSSSVIYQLGQSAICAQTTNLLACGNVMCMTGYGCCASSCYDVTQFSCVTNSNNQQMICNNGDTSCGLFCYSSSSATCCNNVIYALGDSRLPASCGGAAAGQFAGNNNYNGYNGNGGYYYDSNGQFRNCNENGASTVVLALGAVLLSVFAML